MVMKIGLIGGTGFIGDHLARKLHQDGHKVVVIARHLPSNKYPAGIEFIRADIFEPEKIREALKGCHTAVHLVATLAERGTSFRHTIVEGTSRVAIAAQKAGVKQFVYVSALGADIQSPSDYARAKALAELEVKQRFDRAIIIRPSLVMGRAGGFRQQLELLTRYSPFMVLPGYGHTLFQPIELTKLANLLAEAATKKQSKGRTITAVGPKAYCFKQLALLELKRLKRNRILVPLPWWLTKVTAYIFTFVDRVTGYALLPGWVLVTPDQVRLLRLPNTLKGTTSATLKRPQGG